MKMGVKMPLIPLRIAYFLWFGASAVPMTFLSVFMKQKGLTVVQFSSVFSVTFIAQLIVSSISGIVADKIGNVKPIVIFHMLGTSAVIFGILLTPPIKGDTHCEQQKMNLSCFNISDATVLDLTHCKLTVSANGTKDNNETSDSFLTVRNFNNANSTLDFMSSDFLSDDSVKRSGISMCVIRTLCMKLEENCKSFCRDFQTCSSSNDKRYVILYQVLILAFVTFWTSVYRFLDVTVMFLVKTHDSNFGFERVFATVGDFLGAILIAFILDSVTPTVGIQRDYTIVYWVSSGIILLATAAICIIQVPIKAPGKNLSQKAFKLLKDLDTVSFIIVIFVLGNVYCYNFSFHYLFLEKLNAPSMLFGLHTACTPVYGLPILLTSKWWLKTFDATKVFVICLLVYAIGETSYSFLYNPWLSLAIESTTAFTYHLLWVSTVVHCHKIAPEGMTSTVIALPGAIHFGLGRSTGVMGFGLLTDAYGQRITYRVLAVMCLTVAVLYSTFLYWRSSSPAKELTKNGETQ